MKKVFLLIFIVLLSACIPQKEIAPPREARVVPKPVVKPEPQPVTPKKFRDGISCEEKTESVFNRNGLEVQPFVRLAFYDIDSDGLQELVSGGKDGSLMLYKRIKTGAGNRWVSVRSYFDGITSGAFASPAMADIDLDGNPEVIVGTGGFSSESGRIMIFKNAGTAQSPVWRRVDMPVMDVGDDAAPTVVDVNGDNKPDIIVGNSTGALFLYKNTTSNGKISFTLDRDYFRGINIGMYGMPAAIRSKGKLVIIAGNSMGKMYLIERQSGGSSWQKSSLKMHFSNFASPSFMQDSDDRLPNLVISDGYGQIHYYRDTKADCSVWEELTTFFAGRVMAGPVTAPAITELDGKSCMVTGNVNGELKLFEFQPHAEVLPWAEKPDFFKGIKLSGYSRGTVVKWQGRQMLITGQQDGYIRAFINTALTGKPSWKEQKDFFKGVPKTLHASPAVFDLDGDGMWELIVGDVDGKVSAYRMDKSGAATHWSVIEGVFSGIKADRYASPSLVKDGNRIYLFVGQQDGTLQVYSAKATAAEMPLFVHEELLNDLKFNNHSSPAATIKDGLIELSVGDYNGNLRQFACKKERVQLK